MSFITFNVDLKYVGKQLRRIAEALEAIAPPIEEPIALKPEEAVTYVDEQADAVREQAEELGKFREWAESEEQEGWPEGYGEGDIASTPRES